MSLVKIFIQTRAPLIVGAAVAMAAVVGGIFYYRKTK